MRKYKCKDCGACFDENDADEKRYTDDIDYFECYGRYVESYTVPICLVCGSEDLIELDLKGDCEDYDEENGCEGDCDNCPLMTEEGDS